MKHLFEGLVVASKNVADVWPLTKWQTSFGKVLGVITGALERLGHKK